MGSDWHAGGRDFRAVRAAFGRDSGHEVPAERQAVRLSPEEFARFAASLDEAPTTVPELADLFSRPGRIPGKEERC